VNNPTENFSRRTYLPPDAHFSTLKNAVLPGNDLAQALQLNETSAAQFACR
jgi:hypothetical protein